MDRDIRHHGQQEERRQPQQEQRQRHGEQGQSGPPRRRVGRDRQGEGGRYAAVGERDAGSTDRYRASEERYGTADGRYGSREGRAEGPEGRVIAESADRPEAQERPVPADDRIAAARSIFASHPLWSDRAVAALTGLSAKKVAQLRSGAAAERGARRIGRDGRARPVDATRGRELAGELIRSDPGASLRQIAAKTGLAPATVADVRARILRGESPVPARRGRAAPQPSADVPVPLAERRMTPPGPRSRRVVPPPDELLRIFDALRRDPSLRFSESGRSVLRLLDACALVARDRGRIAATVPAHCKESLAQLAHAYAGIWNMLADDLESGRTDLPGPAGKGRVASVGV
ncbi:streptomycin biosynthesis protein [Streptomyces sp. NPDC002004]